MADCIASGREPINRMTAADEALKRMLEKGGEAHFSLRYGSAICPKGEKPVVVSKPMSDEEWEAHLRSIGVRPEVIYL